MLTFLKRQYSADSTVFLFRALSLGTETLRFEYQDNSLGVQKSVTLQAHVVDAQAFEQELAAEEPAGPEDLELASHHMESGDCENALPYWIAVYQDPGESLSAAVEGIVRCCTDLRDYATLAELDIQRHLSLLQDADQLLEAARLFLENGDHPRAREAAEGFLLRFAEHPHADEALYLLGRLYEELSPIRDFRKSRDAYERLYRDFPQSRFSERAYDKVRFLDRHYFEIR